MRYSRVLRFVQNNKGIVQGAASHVGQWRNFDDIALYILVDPLNAQHFVEGVIQWAQVGIDFLCQIARQKTKFLPRLHRWSN